MKKCYIITFELKNPGINQQKLTLSIKSAKVWAKLGPTTYLVVSSGSSIEIRDVLLKHLKVGDKIYVSLLDAAAAWYGYGDNISNWIVNNQK